MKSPLTEAQVMVLAELVTCCADRKLVLVGAAAVGCHVPMTWRQTHDIDIVVLADIESTTTALRAIGLVRHARLEHRWYSESGVQLDVLPASAADLARGKLVWQSGHVMSLEGFDLAFAHSQALELTNAASSSVATVPVIVVLKMIAWLESPHERTRDLEDIGYVLCDYLDDVDLRDWEDTKLAAVQFDQHSAAALGHDIQTITTSSHRKHVERFIAVSRDRESWAFGTHVSMASTDELHPARSELIRVVLAHARGAMFVIPQRCTACNPGPI
jgi:predicted nucleotidyltransferase